MRFDEELMPTRLVGKQFLCLVIQAQKLLSNQSRWASHRNAARRNQDTLSPFHPTTRNRMLWRGDIEHGQGGF